MPFDSEDLNLGEDLISDTRPHWSALLASGTQTVVVLALIVVADLVFPNMPRVVLLILLLACLAVLVRIALHWARWASTHYVLTTDRFVIRWGVLARRSREIQLQRIADLGHSQGVWQRMLGTGSVRIQTIGEQRPHPLEWVSRPRTFKRQIWQQIERGRKRDEPTFATAGRSSVLERIEELEELKRRNLISEVEFALKRDELLDGL